jgi:2,3-bisphosphoglycerate-independent phosphoglycerate mutase
MVGHTGNFEAAVKAVETLDACIARVEKAVLAADGQALVTADHGNCEQMHDHHSEQPHTQHTTEPVPLFYIGNRGPEVQRGIRCFGRYRAHDPESHDYSKTQGNDR